MSTAIQRVTANRANARLSTGPKSAGGKAVTSKNATRHGLLSGRLILDDEDPDEFEALITDLCHSLRPVGIAEATLVERLAVTIWRQRRLVRSETAAISLTREPVPTAKAVSDELRRGYGVEVAPQDLEPFNSDREDWCRTAIAEMEALEEIDLRSIQAQAPTIYEQLLNDAEGTTPEQFLAGHTGGIAMYIGELMLWCRKELREAEARPQLLAIAKLVRERSLVLPPGALEVLARYQTMLDNQLYKALRALREAQEWRLRTLEPGDGHADGTPGAIEAA